jgi:hypothetical protein
MKTENEIIAMSLIERQKLWVEMKAVGTADKDFANSRAIITIIEATDDWDVPEKADAIATDNTIVDGKSVKKGETVTVYEWQFKALRRHLITVEEAKAREEKKEAKKGKSSSGAAALLIGLLLFAFAFNLPAQNLTTITGYYGSYWSQYFVDLNGSTANQVAFMKTNYWTPVITTNTIISPSIVVSNGVTYFNSVTNNTYATNNPAMANLSQVTDFTLTVGCAAFSGSTNINVPSGWDYSSDGVNWQTNRWLTPLTCYGTGPSSTNLDLTGINGGYIRFSGFDNSLNQTILTNEFARIQKKFYRN